jgi:hypothetical protein
MESSFKISSKLYDQNENAFMLLIHNTKAQKEISLLTKIKSGTVIKLFKDTFGQKPNIANLREFFKNDIIKELWWGENGFYHSKVLKEIVGDLNAQERQKLTQHLEKVQQPGMNILLI